MNDEQAALAFLTRILGGDMSPPEEGERPREGDSALGAAAKQLGVYALEMHDFMAELSSGNLACKPPRQNVLLGSSKELQSVLRHLLWTVECISKGDFQQRVDFLGDFSKYFNLFTEQVELREKHQLENAKLEKRILEQKNYLLNELLHKQIEYYNTLSSMHRTVRGMKHDMKNHCFVLNELLNCGDISQAQVYLSEISAQLLTVQACVYNTGNPVFDALLTDKIAKAKDAGITMHVQLAIREGLKIANIDWCVILGNTLDNAIEACLRLGNAPMEIWLETQTRGDIFNLTIKNTALPPVLAADGRYATSKTDGVAHGLGLGNVQNAIEKYGGVMQTKFEDGYFSIVIMLCDV